MTADYATCMDDLIAYFDDLAEHWRGWDGVKVYESLGGELKLKARVDGTGHIMISVDMKDDHHLPHRWTASSIVVTEPGAQMVEAAANAHVLLARYLRVL